VSGGLKVDRPHANCLVRADSLVAFPIVTAADTVVFELAIEKRVAAPAVLQAGFVFTLPSGARRVRVFSFAAPVAADPRAVLAAVDSGALAAALARQAAAAVLRSGGTAAAAACASSVRGAAALLPALRPLAHALLSRRIFRARGEPDWLMAELLRMRAFGVVASLLWLCPRLFCADAEKGPLPLTAASFATGRCFLAHGEDRIWIWVGEGVAGDWMESVFGVGSLAELAGIGRVSEGEGSAALRELIGACWEICGRYLQVEVIVQGDPREAVFNEMLVDDARDCGGDLAEWSAELG
jgi:hypothetical protein